MLLKRKEVLTATPDNKSDPIVLALSQGHDGIVKIILEWLGSNLHIANGGDQSSLPPSAENIDECVVQMQFRRSDSSADILDLNDPPTRSSADCNRQKVVLDSKDSISMPADNGSPTKPSSQPQLPSVGPLKSWYPPNITATHLSITQLILSLAVHLRFIISLICLFAFLLYIVPSWSLDIFSLHQYLSTAELV